MESGVLEGPGEKTLRVTGSIGYAPSIRNMPQDFQILNRLVPIMFQDSAWYWGVYGFMNYYGFSGANIVFTGDYWDMDLPVIVNNAYNMIASDGEAIWVNLYS